MCGFPAVPPVAAIHGRDFSILVIVPELGTARRLLPPGLFLFLIPVKGFVNRPIDKGVDAFPHGIGVGNQGVLIALCQGYIDTIIVVFDVLINGPLVGLCNCQGVASFLRYRGGCRKTQPLFQCSYIIAEKYIDVNIQSLQIYWCKYVYNVNIHIGVNMLY